ncbi:hypothetical protein F4810DRAFT_712650 [Camillea tinctor]|nr:hypothetical protein F4810DRAFT_712650 [Camillea tinctor]
MPPEPPETGRSLGDSINIATRSVHTKLNKLIIYRIPQALPPKADDASKYVAGLLHITPIYMTFEALWQEILDSPIGPSEDQGQSSENGSAFNPPSCFPFPSSADSEPPRAEPARTPSISSTNLTSLSSPSLLLASTPASPSDLHTRAHPAPVSPRVHALLTSLRIPGLARTRALHADLVALTGWSERTLREQLGHAASSLAFPALGSFLAHARAEARRHPHVLVAYAWVLYMALFSGGRYIRATLEGAEPRSFWVPASAPPKLEVPQRQSFFFSPVGLLKGLGTRITSYAAAVTTTPGRAREADAQRTRDLPLRFFRFDTPSDGEDLKAAFKQRLAAADAAALLTPAEREDVVREAQRIFDSLVRVVEELDKVCGSGQKGGAEEEEVMETKLLNLRSRDSVVVEKERERRKIEKKAATWMRTSAEAVREEREGMVHFEETERKEG